MRIVVDFVKEKIGSKAYNLVQLNEAGLSVPPFIIFAFDFFAYEKSRMFLTQKEAELEANTKSLRKISDELRDWVDKRFVEEDKEEFFVYLSSMDDLDTFSVRSSATSEDGDAASFAGQFETVLNVRKNHMLNEVKHVLKSMYRESVLAYIKKHNLSLSKMKMNVIIQSMITGSISGIYFTANPKGLMNEHVIVIGEGIGSNVVEDKIPVTTITYHQDENIYYYEKVDNSPVLDEVEWRKLKEMARVVTAYFGPARDIEFTFESGHLYILQVRPITMLPKGERIILDNSNIVESYPGVTTPLTISFVKDVYSGIMTSLARRLLGNDPTTLQAYEETFDNMVKSVNSRLYYQIQNWYQLLELLPLKNRIIPIWQDMLGIKNTEVPKTFVNVTRRQRIKIMFNAVKEFFRAPRNMLELTNLFKEVESFYYQSISHKMNYKGLWELYDGMMSRIMSQWDITLMNDLNAFIYTGILKKVVKKEEGQSLITGILQIESLKPVQAIHSLMLELEDPENKPVRDKILALENREVWEFLREEEHPVVVDIKRFIGLYGDRAPEELKLETKTYRTHPELFIELLQQYMRGEEAGQYQWRPEEKQTNHTGGKFIAWLQKRAKSGIEYRELSRLNRTRLYGMTRSIFLAMGEMLVSEKKLSDIEDVFFLTLAELRALTLDEKVRINPEKLEIRRWEFQLNKNLPAYTRLEFVGEVFDSFPQNISYGSHPDDSRTIINGIGCSPGKVQGEILVVEDVQSIEAEQAANQIIVTKMTDPGWVYLLSGAKGIIAEKGSLLSHTAIISREMGIPAVVNVTNATQIFRTGDMVELDGQNGRIRRLEK